MNLVKFLYLRTLTLGARKSRIENNYEIIKCDENENRVARDRGNSTRNRSGLRVDAKGIAWLIDEH